MSSRQLVQFVTLIYLKTALGSPRAVVLLSTVTRRAPSRQSVSHITVILSTHFKSVDLNMSNWYCSLYLIIYSGKFSHGARFCAFRGWVGYCENKNRESLNVRTTCGLNTEKARILKPRKNFWK